MASKFKRELWVPLYALAASYISTVRAAEQLDAVLTCVSLPGFKYWYVGDVVEWKVLHQLDCGINGVGGCGNGMGVRSAKPFFAISYW